MALEGERVGSGDSLRDSRGHVEAPVLRDSDPAFFLVLGDPGRLCSACGGAGPGLGATSLASANKLDCRWFVTKWLGGYEKR